MSHKSDYTNRRDRLSNHRHSKGFLTTRFWRNLVFILLGMMLGFVFHQSYKQKTGNQQLSVNDTEQQLTELAQAENSTIKEEFTLPAAKISKVA